MTPQTPRAALSDADIAELVKDIHNAIAELAGVARYPDLTEAIDRLASCAADRRLTAEQGGAEPPKPFCHVVNMLEGLPENPSYIMLFDGQRFGNGFTHTALYTGEQLVAALTTQPQAEPAALRTQPPVTAEQGGAEPMAELIERKLAGEDTSAAINARIEQYADNYVAWARFTDAGRIVLCDSDADGAFKVYRGRAALTTQPPAEPVEDPIQERVLLRAAQPQAEPADAKDAARYRWLRDHSEPAICAFYLSVGKAFDGVKFARKTVDEAIDAQIATPTAPTEPT